MLLFMFLLFIPEAFSLEVIKPEFKGDIELKIVRAFPDSFESYTFVNHNSREATMVCANNRAFDNRPHAFLRYRNFYNSDVDFVIENNKVCQELARFIEQAHLGIDEERPLLMTLSRASMKVTKIVYPNIDPLADEDSLRHLFPKRRVIMRGPSKRSRSLY